MNEPNINSRKLKLIALARDIEKVLQKIKLQGEQEKKENAGSGRMEFAYVEYYLAEISSLLNLSIYLLDHSVFRKYTYFPARLIMEIVLQLEHVYSIKNKKGLDGVRRLLFKDITISAKSSLVLPGEKDKKNITKHLILLDIASKILRLDFKTDDVSIKSNREIKSLCNKSHIIIKKCTGSDLYSFYEILSESSHANIISVGANNREDNEISALGIFEISLELAIRFCEMVIKESNYKNFEHDLGNLKRVAGI
jgi:hypothetical protein